MTWILEYIRSSIGKKQAMALTGLALCGFLVTHLAGNLLILVGPEAYNTYSYKLMSNPFIYVAEIGLALLFLAHIALAVNLIIENQNARPEKYFMKVHTGRGATFGSSSMPYTGFIILVFLVLHVLQFRFGKVIMVEYHGQQMRDLYALTVEVFQRPLYVGWYIFAQIVMGIHVAHGFQSAFSSLGIFHPKYSPCIKKFGIVFAVVLAVGFAYLPIHLYLQGGK